MNLHSRYTRPTAKQTNEKLSQCEWFHSVTQCYRIKHARKIYFYEQRNPKVMLIRENWISSQERKRTKHNGQNPKHVTLIKSYFRRVLACQVITRSGSNTDLCTNSTKTSCGVKLTLPMILREKDNPQDLTRLS